MGDDGRFIVVAFSCNQNRFAEKIKPLSQFARCWLIFMFLDRGPVNVSLS